MFGLNVVFRWTGFFDVHVFGLNAQDLLMFIYMFRGLFSLMFMCLDMVTCFHCQSELLFMNCCSSSSQLQFSSSSSASISSSSSASDHGFKCVVQLYQKHQFKCCAFSCIRSSSVVASYLFYQLYQFRQLYQLYKKLYQF